MGADTSAFLPPGRLGLPWLGETLALLRNPFAFLDVRQVRYGPVFKSRLLGRPTVFLGSAEGAAAFYDDANIGRDDAHPYPIVDLFGGVNMEMYDGPRHRALKAWPSLPSTARPWPRTCRTWNVSSAGVSRSGPARPSSRRR